MNNTPRQAASLSVARRQNIKGSAFYTNAVKQYASRTMNTGFVSSLVQTDGTWSHYLLLPLMQRADGTVSGASGNTSTRAKRLSELRDRSEQTLESVL